MASEPTDDKALIDIDSAELTAAIARVVAAEVGQLTREAINAALGRLD